jgi:hypothetical protein
VASTTTVKRALAALAAGRGFASADESDDDPVARAVADAEVAVERLDTAAEFLTDGGEVRLRRAVERAERGDRRELVRRGQRVLATVEQFRAAAADTDTSETDAVDPPGAPSRETVKPTGGQRPDR